MTRVRKIWIGVGVGVAAVGPALGAAAFSPPLVRNDKHVIAAQHAPKDHSRSPNGAVGGETYLRDGGISDTRTRFSRDMILLHGHALIADEAVKAGDWSTALAHLTTSSEELRSKVEPYMRGQGVASFAAVVAALTKAIEAKDRRKYVDARRAYDAHAERASLAIKKFQTPFLRFQVRAIVEALKVASGAYDAAVKGRSVSDAAEYRDSRGFLLAAERALLAIEPDLAKAEPLHLRDIKKHLIELKTAWPTYTPPKVIIMNADGVALLVSKIEDDAAVYWQ
jgi:hypothetical protein